MLAYRRRDNCSQRWCHITCPFLVVLVLLHVQISVCTPSSTGAVSICSRDATITRYKRPCSECTSDIRRRRDGLFRGRSTTTCAADAQLNRSTRWEATQLGSRWSRDDTNPSPSPGRGSVPIHARLTLRMVVDRSLFVTLGSSMLSARERALELFNISSRHFTALGITLELAQLKVWSETEDCSILEGGLVRMLKFIRECAWSSVGAVADMTIVLTAEELGTHRGAATQGTAGSPWAVAIVQDHLEQPSTVAALISHELGHVIGLEHTVTAGHVGHSTPVPCPCTDVENTCIMDPVPRGTPTMWSTCSRARAREVLHERAAYLAFTHSCPGHVITEEVLCSHCNGLASQQSHYTKSRLHSNRKQNTQPRYIRSRPCSDRKWTGVELISKMKLQQSDHVTCCQWSSNLYSNWTKQQVHVDDASTVSVSSRTAYRDISQVQRRLAGMSESEDEASTVKTMKISFQVAVNGTWGGWGRWSPCPRTCGQSERYRLRRCLPPSGVPAGTATNCDGTNFQAALCSAPPCHGPGLEWSQWSPCTVRCGDGGMRQRQRRCPVSLAVAECPGGSQTQQSPCNQPPCQRAGMPGWSLWSVWSPCSATCGSGKMSRGRWCNTPHQPQTCGGTNTETRACSRSPCGIMWSAWSQWTSCDRTCGSGTRLRRRQCSRDNQCLGEALQATACDSTRCDSAIPAGGGNAAAVWTQWTEWRGCTEANCHTPDSFQRRTRACTGFPTACNGPTTQQQQCSCNRLAASSHRYGMTEHAPIEQGQNDTQRTLRIVAIVAGSVVGVVILIIIACCAFNKTSKSSTNTPVKAAREPLAQLSANKMIGQRPKERPRPGLARQADPSHYHNVIHGYPNPNSYAGYPVPPPPPPP
eukprot:scpid41670/ scgid23830/ Hemicentin-1; Fibulin-6